MNFEIVSKLKIFWSY